MTPLPPPQNLTDTADILRQAAVYVEHGWVQHSMAARADGRATDFWSEQACAVCVRGAIARAAVDHLGAQSKARATLASTLGEELRPFISESTWNDAPARTQAEVVAALRDAADTLSA